MISIMLFFCASMNNDKNIINFLLSTGKTTNSFNICLGGACVGDYKDLVKFAIDNGANDFNTCFHNRFEMAKNMIEHGANNFNECLNTACQHNNKDLIRLMIKHGADKCTYCNKSMEFHKNN